MKELLVPVGNMECLYAAVYNGCDAVYLGGKKFGARAYAANFSDDDMIRAIKFCHLYGVKIYVTVNTLVYESELFDVVDYLKFLYNSGVDAVIIQDIGLMTAVRREIPNLEIHASTQVHSTNQDTLNFLSDLGIKRVVMAREMSIDDINNLNTHLEIETFIHGALCVSYSGQCLFSSMLMNRSGNRGSCAQICRLPFKIMRDSEEIKTEGSYLLSTKELNTANYFKEIMASNIYSLKIEGRMKSAEYVGCVTSLYRDLIDKYYRKEEVIPDKKIMKDLMTIFNREYTRGFLFNATNKDLMNIKTSNHLGIKIGDVIDVNKKYIKIKLSDELNQGDGIRFKQTGDGMIANFIYDMSGKLINHGDAKSIIALDKKFDVEVGDVLNKTLDVKLRDKYVTKEKKIPVKMYIDCLLDKEMTLTLSVRDTSVSISYGIVSKALKIPVGQDIIRKQLSKLGNTPFVLDNLDINVDSNVFINLKDLNELRRIAVDALIEKMVYREIKKIVPSSKFESKITYQDKLNISVLVRNEEQLRCAVDNTVDRIYVSDKMLWNKYADLPNVIYRTNRVKDSHLDYSLITELGSLSRIKKGIGDYYLNVCNHETINYFSNYLDFITLSVELEDDEIKRIMDFYNNKCNLELIVYGTVELMLLKYCPINLNVNKSHKCHKCLEGGKYYLKDRNNQLYRILTDVECHHSHVMHYKSINKIDNIKYYYDLGIRSYRLELLDEDYETTEKLINSLNFNN